MYSKWVDMTHGFVITLLKWLCEANNTSDYWKIEIFTTQDRHTFVAIILNYVFFTFEEKTCDTTESKYIRNEIFIQYIVKFSLLHYIGDV